MNLYIICCKEWKNFIEDDKYKTLESLREARGFLNGIKGYETDVEFAKRGDEALGWKNSTFVEVLYSYINFTFGSEAIGFRTMKIEALIRCVEARNKGMSSEEVYEKYIGIEGSKDSINNLYFGKRLDAFQKKLLQIIMIMHLDIYFYIYGRARFTRKNIYQEI